MLVLPSLDEGFGMPALEAMTIGLPVVASNRGALPEVVGDAGLLVDPEDASALAAAMARVLGNRDAGAAAQRGRHRTRARGSPGTRARPGCSMAIAAAVEAPPSTMTRPLRIGVDARELLGDATGVGRYLGELLRRWTVRTDAAARRFVLYSPEPLPLALPLDTIEPRVVGSGRGTWWEQTHLRRAVMRRFARRLLRAGLHRAARRLRCRWR